MECIGNESFYKFKLLCKFWEESELSKRSQSYLKDVGEEFMKRIGNSWESAHDWYIVLQILKFFEVSPKVADQIFAENHERIQVEDVDCSIKSAKNKLSFSGILCLFKHIEYKLDSGPVINALHQMPCDVSESELEGYLNFLNKVDSSVCHKPFFNKYYQKLFKAVESHNIISQMKPFAEQIRNFLLDLDEEKSKNFKSLQTAGLLARFKFHNEELVNKFLDIHLAMKAPKDPKSLLILGSLTRNSEYIQKLRETTLYRFIKTVDLMPTKVLLEKILVYMNWPYYEGRFEEEFSERVCKKIETVPSSQLGILYGTLESLPKGVCNQHYKLISDILNSGSKAIISSGEKVSTPKNTIKALNVFTSHFQTKDPFIYDFLFKELGKNYYKFTTSEKASVLQCLGRRGIKNSEVFKTVAKDVKNDYKAYVNYSWKIVNAIAENNFENEEWAQELLEILTQQFKVQESAYDSEVKALNWLWTLAKIKADSETLDLALKHYREFSKPTRFSTKKLFMFYYFWDELSRFGSQEEFDFTLKKQNLYNIWGLRVKSLASGIENTEFKLFEAVKGVHVPGGIPEKNHALFVKTPSTVLYESNNFKGEFEFLKGILTSKGVKVSTVNFSDLKTFNGT